MRLIFSPLWFVLFLQSEEDLKYDLAFSWKRHDFAASCIERAPGDRGCQTVSAACLLSCAHIVRSWESQPVVRQLQNQGHPGVRGDRKEQRLPWANSWKGRAAFAEMRRTSEEKAWGPGQEGAGRVPCAPSPLPLADSLLGSQSPEGGRLANPQRLFLRAPRGGHGSTYKPAVLKQVPAHPLDVGVKLWGQSVVPGAHTQPGWWAGRFPARAVAPRDVAAPYPSTGSVTALVAHTE